MAKILAICKISYLVKPIAIISSLFIYLSNVHSNVSTYVRTT
jgi:hypothetical protein